MPHTPLDTLPVTGRTSRKPWGALVGSVLAHVVVIALLLYWTRDAPQVRSQPTAAPEQVQTVVLSPPAAVPVRPPPPPPPRARRRVEDRLPLPQVKRGRENIPEDPPTPEPAPVPPTAAAVPAPQADAPVGPPSTPRPTTDVASAAPTLESEARRLFGPRSAPLPSRAEPAAPWNNGPTEPRDNDCRPRPRPARPAGEPITLEFVEGWVYNESTHIPLAGAYLQIMGTGYSTFADGRGHYRLGFDPSLVDECRSQYVRVVATGVPSQLIVLGRGVGGTDIYLRP